MDRFLKTIATASNNIVESKIENFKNTRSKILFIGTNSYMKIYGKHFQPQYKNAWLGQERYTQSCINRLTEIGLYIAGVVDYDESEDVFRTIDNKVITWSELFNQEYIIIITNAFFAYEKNILAFLLNEHNVPYIDFGYINNQFSNHYNPHIFYKNIDKCFKAYALLADEESQKIYLSLIQHRMTRDSVAVKKSAYPQYFHPIVRPNKNECIIEAGACDGETAIEISNYLKGECKIYAFEPDKSNFEKAVKRVRDLQLKNIDLINKGLWSEETTLDFCGDQGASSQVGKNNNNENSLIDVTAIDKFVGENNIHVDLIKMDVEGVEGEILLGAKETIALYQPKLQISVYHKPEDLWELLLMVHEINPYYKFYMGHHTMFPNETILYAII